MLGCFGVRGGESSQVRDVGEEEGEDGRRRTILRSQHSHPAARAPPAGRRVWLILFACRRMVAARLIASWCGTVMLVWHQRLLHVRLAGVLQLFFLHGIKDMYSGLCFWQPTIFC